jgi:hypothetical protein
MTVQLSANNGLVMHSYDTILFDCFDQLQALDLGSCNSTSMLVGYTKTMTEDNTRQCVVPKNSAGFKSTGFEPQTLSKDCPLAKGWGRGKLNLSLHPPAATKHVGPIASQKGMSSLVIFQRAPDRPMLDPRVT